MTLSVPSFLAAAISAFMPPPAEAEVSVDQLAALPVPLPEPDEEPDDEQPAASSAAAAAPASASRYVDLTSAS